MASLFQLSISYFTCYIATGILVKLFTGKLAEGFFGLNSIQYLVYSTTFSSLFCVGVVLLFSWQRRSRLSGREIFVLFLSGACTAYIIPTSTLIISLPISIMIAMVLMRGSVIVASRLVDLILNLEGLQKKRIPWQEEVSVLLSIAAICVKIFFEGNQDSRFPNLGIALLVCYFFAYLLRLYIMNRSKLKGLAGQAKLDQRLYFGVEQIFASATLFGLTLPLFFWQWSQYESTGLMGRQFVDAVLHPHPKWMAAAISGTPYALVAFLSVFLFLYPGKTATFTGVLNRLVSLAGGTAASLLLYLFFSGPFPPAIDWIALALIIAAIGFLAWGDHVEGGPKFERTVLPVLR